MLWTEHFTLTLCNVPYLSSSRYYFCAHPYLAMTLFGFVTHVYHLVGFSLSNSSQSLSLSLKNLILTVIDTSLSIKVVDRLAISPLPRDRPNGVSNDGLNTFFFLPESLPI